MNEKMTAYFARGQTQRPSVSTQTVIAILLMVALVAFESFNYDTSRFALANLLGDVRFLGVSWATILAIAFCSIDFAGLVRFFMTDEAGETHQGAWYLMGAWLLGATMNALLTWWAVSLTLLSHELGNEVVGRQFLLDWVPVFIAVLVWLTRILFIGSFTVAGGHLFPELGKPTAVTNSLPTQQPLRERPLGQPRRQPTRQPAPALRRVTDEAPAFLQGRSAGITAVSAEESESYEPVTVGERGQRRTPAPMYARPRR